MHHDIIDNQTTKLVDAIRTYLPRSEAAKFALGYFFISGLEAVADALYNVQDLRLLIGNTTNRETIEQIAEGYRRLAEIQDAAEALQYPRQLDRARAAEATADAVGETLAHMAQTDEAATLVRTLVDLIESGRLHVRVHTNGRLHAKAYILDYGPSFDQQGRPHPPAEKGLAILGSSNLSLAGISANAELNVVVHGDANHAALTDWFEALWDEAEAFEQPLMTELRHSWTLAAVTPYELYLKTLYELVRDQLAGIDAAGPLWRDDILAVLTEFQDRAVRQAVQMIRRYGGCFVSDVVGLGKSYIGAAIVKIFERQDRARPLIICPAPLVEMWQHYNQAYQLNAHVLSLGRLQETEAEGPEWMLTDPETRDRDFVLVDESHTFRHTRTQRYRVLQSFLAAGDRKAAFLTATPRNQSVWDIYNQIKLFHPREITDLPIDPPHLRDFFKLVEAGERRLPALLSHLLIRRKRMDVLRWYGYDAETDARIDPDHFQPYRDGERRAYVRVGGRKQVFPERVLQTIEYSIEAVYGDGAATGEGTLYDQLRRRLSGPGHGDGAAPDLGAAPEVAPTSLTYARYGLWHYVKGPYRDRPPYTNLKRAGANLRGLMRVMLFKRFESSVHAFRETVGRLLRSQRAFLTALDAGIVAAGEAAQEVLNDADIEEERGLVDALSGLADRYDPAHFRRDALRADVAADIAILREILALVAPIDPARDAKLQTLKGWLVRPALRDRKVLIFTQYADTAQYLYDNLTSAGDGGRVEVITSQERNKAEIVGRFAPRANPQHRTDAAPEIETLIATDVLAEGLNLQDCDTVINYDLHWNPVRLIQRFGRIDRIGTEHDRITGYNFLPERALERNLGLHEKLRARIQEIHDTIGEDAAILDPSEQLNEEALYTIYTQGNVGHHEEDEVDAFVDMNEALETMRQIKEDQPDLYRRITELRDGIRCGARQGTAGTVVLCRAGRYQQLTLVDDTGEVVTTNAPRILNAMKCAPDTPAAPLPEGHNARVSAVLRAFERAVVERRAEQRHTYSLTRAQRYVLAELQMARTETGDAARQGEIDRLAALINAPIARPAVHEALNRLRRDSVVGVALVDALTALNRTHRLDRAPAHRSDEDEGPDPAPHIVCSEGWWG